MEKSFWLDKPLQLCNEYNVILSESELFNKVCKDIELYKFQLDYKILYSSEICNEKLDSIVDFLNNNYITSDDTSLRLVYTKELISFYLGNKSIIIEFYPRGKSNIIGYISGKPSELCVNNDTYFKTSEVNFLCVIPKLRNLGVSGYIINILTKELVRMYNITTGYYTTSTSIKTVAFSTKKFYHRMINILSLYKTQFLNHADINLLVNEYNTFNIDKIYEKTHTIEYSNNCSIDDDILSILYSKYIQFCKSKYKIYEHVSVDEFKNIFTNSSFHNFIIRDINRNIVSFISLFRLDTYNDLTKYTQKSGYYYYMFLNDTVNDLEFVSQFIYKNGIFDIITFGDIFNIDYKSIKCIQGSSILKYYWFNMVCKFSNSYENGLITI